MAVSVDTNDVSILIDPSVALSPRRKGLPPSKKELKLEKQYKNEIRRKAKHSDIIFISHYHYDHVSFDPEIYAGKDVYIKDITKHINKSQQQRGDEFFDLIKENCRVHYCDDSNVQLNQTILTFSPPFFHGPKQSRLGYVIMLTIDNGEKRVLYSSDVQGPVDTSAKDYIINQQPQILLLDGPPTYLLGWRFSQKNLNKAIDNTLEIISKTQCQIILDHHLYRDVKYKKRFKKPFDAYKKKYKEKMMSYAQYQGKQNRCYEAKRKQFLEKEKNMNEKP